MTKLNSAHLKLGENNTRIDGMGRFSGCQKVNPPFSSKNHPLWWQKPPPR